MLLLLRPRHPAGVSPVRRDPVPCRSRNSRSSALHPGGNICGTDKEICSFEYGTPPPGDDHLVIGHESLAEIVQVGSAVERFEVGDLVVPSVRRPCPHDAELRGVRAD